MSALLAERLGVEHSAVEMIRMAAPLHDIGKVGIPDGILLKPGALNDHEFEIMKTHTVIGATLLSNGRSELVRVAEKIARSHHEWWNGDGYPDSIKGESIALEARIVAVADFVDALTHDRPYRRAHTVDETLAEVVSRSGTHFDPDVVSVFLSPSPV